MGSLMTDVYEDCREADLLRFGVHGDFEFRVLLRVEQACDEAGLVRLLVYIYSGDMI